jgi:hypothetical protein
VENHVGKMPERAQGRIHSFEGHRKGELGKEILLMIAAGLAIPAAFLMPNIPLFDLFIPLVGDGYKAPEK